jgi:hypothetical protein
MVEIENKKVENEDFDVYECSHQNYHNGCYGAVFRAEGETFCKYNKCRLDDNGKIKPIETEYKGYRFRSRLEARWAIFFDTLNIKWDYEMEGYELGDGMGDYLPDFSMGSNNNMTFMEGFLEVKPILPSIDEINKMAKLCFITGKRGTILFGSLSPPSFNSKRLKDLLINVKKHTINKSQFYINIRIL